MFFWEFALESSLLVLMILGIRKIFTGKVRYAGIYALWLLVLLRFLIPVNFVSTPFSAGAMIPETFLPQDSEVISERGLVQVEKGTVSRDLTGKATEKSNMAEEVQKNDGTALQQPGGESGNVRHTKGYMYLKTSWLIVSGLLLCWFVMSNVCLARKLKRSRVMYGKRNKVRIYAASDVQNPCLYGFFRPAIYLPKALVTDGNERRADEEEIEQMITHEYVHYCHGDHIWAMFRVLLVSVYWFDPLLWLAVSCSKKDAELFCDETVIRLLGEEKRFCYGKMLVRLAGDVRWGEFRYPIMSMSRRGKEMEKRILAISNKKKYSRWIAVPLAVLVLVAAGITCSTASREAVGQDADVVSAREGILPVEAGFDVPGGEQGKTTGQDSEPEEGNSISAGGETEEETINADMSAVERTFDEYMTVFTNAVNTGNTDQMYQVLAADREVYTQQCDIVKNYYKRGIREKIKTYSITSEEMITPQKVEICSKEKIKVYYSDDTTKIIRQKYRYTCEYVGDRWMITGMEDLSEVV